MWKCQFVNQHPYVRTMSCSNRFDYSNSLHLCRGLCSGLLSPTLNDGLINNNPLHILNLFIDYITIYCVNNVIVVDVNMMSWYHNRGDLVDYYVSYVEYGIVSSWQYVQNQLCHFAQLSIDGKSINTLFSYLLVNKTTNTHIIIFYNYFGCFG